MTFRDLGPEKKTSPHLTASLPRDLIRPPWARPHDRGKARKCGTYGKLRDLFLRNCRYVTGLKPTEANWRPVCFPALRQNAINDCSRFSTTQQPILTTTTPAPKMMRTSVTKLARPARPLSRMLSTTARVMSAGDTGAPPKTGGLGYVAGPLSVALGCHVNSPLRISGGHEPCWRHPGVLFGRAGQPFQSLNSFLSSSSTPR